MRDDFPVTVSEEKDQASYMKDLWRSASKDSLSGLMNRDAMERHIREKLERMTQNEICALFIIDLDNFKTVNDTLGHPVGDEAIRQASKILSGIFRANDIVGRLGGDEFAAFMCGEITEESVREKAEAICEKLQMTLGGHETVNVTASVGIHMAEKGQRLDGLYQSADLALYKAKKAGKHQFCLKNRDNIQRGGMHPANVITLGALLENMESGVALLEMGENPQITYVSPSFFRILGVDEEYFHLPKPLYELIHPDDLMATLSLLREGIAREQVVESIHRVHAGEECNWLWWQVRAVKIDDRGSTPVMLVTTTDVSKLKEAQYDQEARLRRLQTAFDMTAQHVWEVDLGTGFFHSDIPETQDEALREACIRFPEDLIAGGWIHPDSVERFRSFAKELLDGRARGFGNFAVRRNANGCYGWVSLSYRILFDDAGQAIQAVGVAEDLPGSFIGLDNWPPNQQRLPENLVVDLVVWMQANLTLDSIEAMWLEGSDISTQVQGARCSEFLRMDKQHIFCKGDQQNFVASYDRDMLLRLYQDGQRWLCAEYRRADHSGNIRWVRHILYLAENPVTKDVFLFVYLLWLDPDRRFEKLILGTPERDKVTRLYTRDAVRRMAEALFSDRKSGNRAVVVFQINGMEQLPSGPEKDRLLSGLSSGLSLVLGGSCLLGQHSPQQIVAVFPGITEKNTLRRRLEESVSVLRRMLAPEPAYHVLRFVIGVDLLPAATANYRFMLMRTIETCALHWSTAVDTVMFAREQEKLDWEHLYTIRDGYVTIHKEEMERPLSEREKNLALDGVSVMLAAKTLDASITGVLKAIGEYYRADRVYSLMLVEKNSAVLMTFEWTNGIKPSIQQVVSGMPLEKFPLLTKCMREQAPVFLARPGSDGPDSDGTAERPWHFTVFPLMHEGKKSIDGFLCIENARRYPSDAAVFSTLIPFMLQQRERFRNIENSSSMTRRLMSVPDLRAYIDTLRTLNSDYYSSMGAVCLEIPGFTAVNNKQGFEYGSRMLWYVSNIMTELFGQELLFRIREAEFIAFCPNTTRAVFLGRCGRLWSVLQRRYPKQVRMGQSWANGTFTGEHLAEMANGAMRSAHTELFAQELSAFPGIMYASVSDDPAWRKQFTVYFQPKVDMRNGALVGAEALARRIAEDGTIIQSMQFIPLLEENGAIRDLDLFVLERSLAQMERWQSEGFGIVPISVNLSRTTLAHPAILASVLAIQSRYPEIPASALELEITESGNGFKTSELRDFVEQFRACGLHMSLDDFGSQYANLSLFTNVKFDTVKLDQSLISDLGSNPISRMLVRDLVEICRTCGMTCVAEGVETEEQIAALLEIGSVYAQGFYYDRPLSASAFEQKYLRHGSLINDKESVNKKTSRKEYATYENNG